MSWVLWLVVACAFGAGEMLTTSFFLAPFSVGGALATVLALAGGGALAEWVVFVCASLATLAFLRPIALRHLHAGPQLRTGAAALVGKQAIVIERIANEEGVGCVRIDGEIWTARAFDDEVIEPGERVHVMQIRGATALVAS